MANEHQEPTPEHEPSFYRELDILLKKLEVARELSAAERPGRCFMPYIHPQPMRYSRQVVAAERAVVAHVIDWGDMLTFDNQRKLLEAFDLCGELPSEQEYLEQSGLAVGALLSRREHPLGMIVASCAKFMLTGPGHSPELRVTIEATLHDGTRYFVPLEDTRPLIVMELN